MTVATAPTSATLPADHEEPKKVSIWRIVRLFRPYRGLMSALLALVLVRSIVGVVSPFLLRAILDRGLPERNVTLISTLAIGMIVASVTASSLGVWTGQLASVIGQRVMHDLRVGVYGHLQRLSLAFFTRTKTGDVLSRVVNDVGGVDNVLTNTATATVQSGAQAIAIAAALVIMDWQLAAVDSSSCRCFCSSRSGWAGSAGKSPAAGSVAWPSLTTIVEESLSVPGVLLAKTMGLGGEMNRRFATRSKEISDLELASALAGRWQIATRGAALTVIPAIAYWIVGIELAHGASPTTLGTVVAFTSMLNRLVSPVSSMQGVGQAASTSVALFGRIFDVLDLPSTSTTRRAAPTSSSPAVRSCCGTSPSAYPDAPAPTLDGIDLVATPGSVTAIVGRDRIGQDEPRVPRHPAVRATTRPDHHRRHRHRHRRLRIAVARGRPGRSGHLPPARVDP